jgi:hypothetical protein
MENVHFFLLWEQYGAKKGAKKPVVLPHDHWQKQFFSGPDRRCTSLIFLRGVPYEGRYENIKKSGGGLIDAMVALAAPTFLVRLSL